jgi:hypothetical protein
VARGAKRLTGTEDLKLTNLLCVLFNDSVSQVRKDEIQKIRQAYDMAVLALNTDTLSNVLDFIPEQQRIFLPDTLFKYVPMKPSITYDDTMMTDVKKWVKGRGLVKN